MKTIECGEPCCLCILYREMAACTCAMCIASSIHARLCLCLCLYLQNCKRHEALTRLSVVSTFIWGNFVKRIRFEVIEGL